MKQDAENSQELNIAIARGDGGYTEKATVYGNWIVAGAVLLVSLGINLLPEGAIEEIIRENSVVEIITATWYLFSAFLLFKTWKSGRGAQLLWSGLVVLFLGLRELDFHARFTTMGIFKSRFYISPEVPFTEKFIVSIIVLCMIGLLLYYLKTNAVTFITALKENRAWAWSLAAAVICILLSKILDGNSELFQFLFSASPFDPELLIWTMEEVIEMAIPAYFLLAVYDYRLRRGLAPL